MDVHKKKHNSFFKSFRRFIHSFELTALNVPLMSVLYVKAVFVIIVSWHGYHKIKVMVTS